MRLFREKLFLWLGEEKEKTTNLGKAIGVLIAFSVGLAVISTEPIARGVYGSLLTKLDIAVAVLFFTEYILRLWVAPLRRNTRGGGRGALNYALTPLAILDLLAIAPTILGFVTPELYLLRIIRLARISRIGRSKRFRKSIKHFNHAITSKKEELQISAVYTGIVIFVSSILMYIAEGPVQQEQFGSIPRCLWWSIVTVTTVGYGDVYPVTFFGRLIAALTAICGVAVIAIPIGIISAGFTESLGSERS
ncbi:ion transporter [Synechococcus sp. A10-1-5-1]|uniref:ion transporter n=1 Tax=Synechococcus sp. A10-1-5-1 TaxID=2936507 RepID=UPI0020014B70|nr:ion transporter [Synechococcus sp. A10-1-5-1]UPM50130.1 ion transporter [Synechococcus sp. A10-1-5-1]